MLHNIGIGTIFWIVIAGLERSSRALSSRATNPWTSDVRGKEVISVVALLTGKKCWRIKTARRFLSTCRLDRKSLSVGGHRVFFDDDGLDRRRVIRIDARL